MATKPEEIPVRAKLDRSSKIISKLFKQAPEVTAKGLPVAKRCFQLFDKRYA